MNDIFNEETIHLIPIKVDNYESLFNELDYRALDKRELNEDVDTFIDTSIINADKKIITLGIELIIHLPIGIKDSDIEANTKKGIINHYEFLVKHQKKIKIYGVKRIIYYMIIASILLTAWYYMVKFNNESFLTSLLNAGGTVLLWEIMSLVLIEKKNADDRDLLNKKLSRMKITFKYI